MSGPLRPLLESSSACSACLRPTRYIVNPRSLCFCAPCVLFARDQLGSLPEDWSSYQVSFIREMRRPPGVALLTGAGTTDSGHYQSESSGRGDSKHATTSKADLKRSQASSLSLDGGKTSQHNLDSDADLVTRSSSVLDGLESGLGVGTRGNRRSSTPHRLPLNSPMFSSVAATSASSREWNWFERDASGSSCSRTDEKKYVHGVRVGTGDSPRARAGTGAGSISSLETVAKNAPLLLATTEDGVLIDSVKEPLAPCESKPVSDAADGEATKTATLLQLLVRFDRLETEVKTLRLELRNRQTREQGLRVDVIGLLERVSELESRCNGTMCGDAGDASRTHHPGSVSASQLSLQSAVTNDKMVSFMGVDDQSSVASRS
jgi:hypothetical protein